MYMEMIGNSNLDGPRASGKQFFDLCDDRRLALDDIEPNRRRRLCRSERLYRAKVGKRLVVCTKRLNTDVRGSGRKMRLNAIANPILSAPCDNRVD